MSSKHVEYKRIVEGADTAVLFIHGILSTPNHFRELIPIVPEKYSILAMVTAGHCQTVGDFSRSSLERWESSVQAAVDELFKTHKQIYIVGHSMGTLFGIEQAMKDKRVKGVFCISIPIKVKVRARMVPMALKVYRHSIKEDEIVAGCLNECYGIEKSEAIYKYLGWIPRFLDLFKLIKRVRRNLYALETPCVAFQSVLDELVSPKSVRILKNESNIKVHSLASSTHFYYADDEMELIKRELIDFLE